MKERNLSYSCLVGFSGTVHLNGKDYTEPSMNTENGMDYDLGLVLGWKLNSRFGVFVEGRYLNMYDIQSYEAKTGFNWLIY